MPKVPMGLGAQIIINNMREARRNGMPRNMVLPSTYFWFYRMVRNKGRWDYKQFNPFLLILEISISEPQALLRVSLIISC